MRRHLTALFMVLVLAGGLASAATLTVPAEYPTITAALAAAAEDNVIVVTSDYTGVGEQFPILVQKDGITIQAEPGVEVRGESSKAVFVVGAHRVVNQETWEYETRTVSGVTVKGFTIVGPADIGIAVKEARDIDIEGNYITGSVSYPILEGIRLFGVTDTRVSGNTIRRMGAYDPADEVYTGIGINVEQSHDDVVLSGNTVTECGLGLFVHASSYIGVDGDEYFNNAFGGVVLNDTRHNVLEGLTVTDNGGWGVRFVNGYDDTLEDSVVTYNLGGGVQLIASKECSVEGNLVASNGNPIAPNNNPNNNNDENYVVQIVIAPGDRALFSSPVIDTLNTLREPEPDRTLITKPMSDFVLEKHQIEEKLNLLEWWLHDLNDELKDPSMGIRQRVSMKLWDEAEALLRAMLRYPETPADSGPITRGDIADHDPVDIRNHGMGKPEYNFTWWDIDDYGDYAAYQIGDHPFDQRADLLSVGKLDFYSDPQTPSFGLFRGDVATTGDSADELSWDKIGLISILIDAIGNELVNGFTGVAWCHEDGYIETTDEVELLDSLQEKLNHWHELGLITDATYSDLNPKLAAVIGLNNRLRRALIGDGGPAFGGGITVNAVSTNIAYQLAQLYVAILHEDDDAARAAINTIDAIKAEMFFAIEDMYYKLGLLDLELPPFPEVNSNLLGKKEKPFLGITETEIGNVKYEIAIGGDAGISEPIRKAFREIYDVLGYTDTLSAIEDDQLGTEDEPIHSVGNTISSNIITYDLPRVTGVKSIGIVIASPHNLIVNNLITNEGIPELDDYLSSITVGDTPIYARTYRLDIGMWMLSDECLIAYNALEFVDWGIKRGGTWEWEDYQLEYVFTKLARVSYWPGPGQILELHRYPGLTLPPGHDFYPPLVYTDHLPVLALQQGEYRIEVEFVDCEVVGNRLSLNFFDRTGTGIEIIRAHSNLIDGNLFYNVSSGNIIFGQHAHPGITLRGNDHYGGPAVTNNSGFDWANVNASADYTPPAGQPGHASVHPAGRVSPPTAPGPHAFINFLEAESFTKLEAWFRSLSGVADPNLARYQQGLPPNLDFFIESITLPYEKPRHPNQIFERPEQPPEEGLLLKKTFSAGVHLMSVPVVPDPNTPENVFKSITDAGFPIVLAEYVYDNDNETGKYKDPTEIIPGRGYWVYLFDEVTIQVSGELTPDDFEVELEAEGLHMISTPKWQVAVGGLRFKDDIDERSIADAIGDAPEWLAPLAFAYNSETGQYEPLTLASGIDAWKGYWIMTRVEDLTMILPDNPWPYIPLGMSESVPTRIAPTWQPPAPPAWSRLGAELLTAMSYPNPVGGGQATFRVTGLPVSEVRVTVLDIGGRTVWQSAGAGNQLSWSLVDKAGKAVANGVYLYFMEAKVGDQWLATRVDRLLIVR